MTLWFALFLGLVQGLTEFLPISSTAHLRILPAFLGYDDPGATFTAILQLGTLGSLLVYFHKECRSLVRSAWNTLRGTQEDPQQKTLLGAVLIGTLPISVLGFLFQDWIRNEFRSLWVVAGALIVVALFLFAAERLGKRDRQEDSLRLSDGLWVGLAQAMALVPGASRAGSCLVVALLLGFQRPAAARFSFILGIPALLAAGVLECIEIWPQLDATHTLHLTAGALTSGIVGYFTIWGFLQFLKKHSNAPFILYRVLLGLLLVGCMLTGKLDS